jgi:NAD(P)H-dependent flavin oxidoreductase YrpB (nitropropane dioxygenase family)
LNQGNHLMPSPWPRNRLTEMLAIDYPIVQGPLGGLSSQRLTAAVSNFGGLHLTRRRRAPSPMMRLLDF